MKKYPECFPENFETDILPKDAKKENKSVYRFYQKVIHNLSTKLSIGFYIVIHILYTCWNYLYNLITGTYTHYQQHLLLILLSLLLIILLKSNKEVIHIEDNL